MAKAKKTPQPQAPARRFEPGEERPGRVILQPAVVRPFVEFLRFASAGNLDEKASAVCPYCKATVVACAAGKHNCRLIFWVGSEGQEYSGHPLYLKEYDPMDHVPTPLSERPWQKGEAA